MYSDCLTLESYCCDFFKVFRFVFGFVCHVFLQKKAKHTLICLKNKSPNPRFRIICFWSTKHRMLGIWHYIQVHRFCCCTSTSGKVLFNIIVSLSLSQEDWEGPSLVWRLFPKAVFEEEQLGFSLSLLLAGIGSQFVASDMLPSSLVIFLSIYFYWMITVVGAQSWHYQGFYELTSADDKIDIHEWNPFVRETRRVIWVPVSGFG